MSEAKVKAYYVPSTHWDREWYDTFQGFRYYLVELLDTVLETMTRDPRYKVFQTDGQSIILEDYLEIRPEEAERVRQFAREGRLRIGPWYTMPDENLVSGESMVRNLEEGLRVAKDFGNQSRVGFICDMFGHVAQMPQIFRGFGIDNAFVFRGLNEFTHKGTFRWLASDGSEVVSFRFGPREGYFDYAANVRRAFFLDEPFDIEGGAERMKEYVALQRERTGIDEILLFDGGDHMPIEPQTPDMIETLKKIAPEIEVEHTGLDEYAAALQRNRERIPRSFQGELRTPALVPSDGGVVIPGTLASRVRLKQDLRARETELCCWVEPIGLLAEQLAEYRYPANYIRRSWRYVMENHAHDSICGCSPDQVHKDMDFRFDQSRLINEKVLLHGLRAVATRVDLPDQENEDFALVVFNPTQTEIDGPVDLELWFDEKTKNIYMEFFGYETKVGFRLYDADDNELPYDYIRYWPQRRRHHRAFNKIPMGQECIVVSVTTPLKIPAFGYTTITCKPEAMATRHPLHGVVKGDRVLENEHLKVTVEANGSLTLHDKRTDESYSRLLVFEDRADIGDGWYHGVAVNDRILSSTASPADVAVVADGRLKGTLRITNRMAVPKSFVWNNQMVRSEETETLVIHTEVTLRAGSEKLECVTSLNNNVRDHRLRVLFESGTEADSYEADSAFDVITRPVGLPNDAHTYRELPIETTPQYNWTAIADQQRGLAVVAPGLLETTVRDEPQRALALTLLRGFRRTIFTDGEEGGQVLGQHRFAYQIVPLKGGAIPRQRLGALGYQQAAGLRTSEVQRRYQAPAEARTLPRTYQQLALQEQNALVSSFRRFPENGKVEVRLYNVLAEPVTETVKFTRPVDSAAVVDFDGNQVEALQANADGAVQVKLGPKKIVTVHVALKE